MVEIIYIENQDGVEAIWKVEKELDKMYEVFHDFLVTHIDKSLVYQTIENGKKIWKYPKILNIPYGADQPVHDYFVWTT